MSRYCAGLLFMVPLFAANSVVIHDSSGSTQTARPTTISRVFTKGEFPSGTYPQPHVTAGNIATYQVDVKNTWSDGSVKHALISFPVTVTANGSTTVDFVQSNSAASSGSALDLAGMLAFGGGTWDASLAAAFSGSCSGYGASGSTCTVKPRDLIQESITASKACGAAGSNCRYWMQGPVVTQVIIEGPRDDFAHVFDYDFGSTSGHAIHPMFIVTFYAGQSAVKVDFIAENVWTSKVLDQTYTVTLKTGSALTTQYTKSSFTHIGHSRWRKTYWSGTAIGSVWVDFNLAYMAASGAVMNWDTSLTGVDSSGDVSTFTGSDQGDLGGYGVWYQSMEAPGGRIDIGVFPANYVRYLYDQSATSQAAVMGNAEVSGHINIHWRESSNTLFYDRQGTVNALAKPVSLDARASLPSDAGSTTSGGWNYDMGHFPSWAYLPYILSGDYYLLEENYFMAAYHPFATDRGCHPYGSCGAWGYLTFAVQTRGQAWGLRDIGHAAFVAPDGTPEAAYFAEKINNNITIEEGFQSVTSGSFPPSSQSCPGYPSDHNNPGSLSYSQQNMWCYGNLTQTISPDGSHAQMTNPLHFPNWGNASTRCDEGFVTRNPTIPCFNSNSPWQYAYKYGALGHLYDLGLPIGPFLQTALKFIVNHVANPDVNPYTIGTYTSPVVYTVSSDVYNYIQTWANYNAGFARSYHCDDAADPQTLFNVQTGTGFILSTCTHSGSGDVETNAPGYPHIMRAAVVYAKDLGVSDGAGITGDAAYTWMNDQSHVHCQTTAAGSWTVNGTTVSCGGTISANPQWQTLPRAPASCSISASGVGTGTVGQAITYTFTATDCSCPTCTWTVSSGTIPAGTSGCSSSTGSSCSITGTLTTATSYSFNVHLVDGASDTADSPQSVTVNAAAAVSRLSIGGGISVPQSVSR